MNTAYFASCDSATTSPSIVNRDKPDFSNVFKLELSGQAIHLNTETHDPRLAGQLLPFAVSGSGYKLSWKSGRLLSPDASDKKRWATYLAELDSGIYAGVASSIRLFWSQLVQFETNSPLPLVYPVDDPENPIVFRWESERYLVKVDFCREGGFHWFFRDRATGLAKGTDETPVREIPDELVSHIRQFI